ncbi:MAG: M13 family metallopeptidase [Clostridia bacterium]|nr:M13 family metallopeptidase [Clostridia bacterium]
MSNKAKETSVRIQDDLFQSVNSEWLSSVAIPSDKPAINAFEEIDVAVEEKLTEEFDRLAENYDAEGVPALKDAVLLYKKALDTNAREEAGIKPLLPLLERIKNVKSVDEFNLKSVDLMLDGVAFPFVLSVDEDVKDTTKHCLSVADPPIIIPDKSIYDKKIIRFFILSIYKKMMKKLLALTPLTKKEQKEYLSDSIKVDDSIRKLTKSPTEMADYVKLFNPMDLKDACDALKPFDFNGLMKGLYKDGVPAVINVYNPAYVKGFGSVFNERTFKAFVHWAYVGTLYSYAPALSKTISDLSKIYVNKLMGVKDNPTIKKQAYRLVSGEVFAGPVGVYYGKKYFGEKAKEDITFIAERIIAAYKDRMARNTFLAPETKEKAILKLDSIRVKMGYPDKYDEVYDSLKVSEDESFFDAMYRIKRTKLVASLNELNKPTDFSKWAMPAHVVNACYDPFKNDITFPAAILQKPFYGIDQSLEENLGGIGAVIGHEISHAFDNNGSHFDEKGCMNNWWKDEDFKKFEVLTEDMVKQFDGIIYHGAKVNGKLVVSENIADNGGVGVTLEIINGLQNADYRAYFTNWGRIWRFKAKENYIKLLLRLDVHSPAELRANIAPRNFSEWYKAFDVKETDKMFIEEGKRISIW